MVKIKVCILIEAFDPSVCVAIAEVPIRRKAKEDQQI